MKFQNYISIVIFCFIASEKILTGVLSCSSTVSSALTTKTTTGTNYGADAPKPCPDTFPLFFK